MVKIIFLGPFGPYMPEEDENGYWMADVAGQTVKSIVEKTEAKDSIMNYSVIVNDLQVEEDYIMKDDDEIAVLPLFHAG